MKVVHAILGFHPQIGGAENQAQLLVDELLRQGVNVEVFTRRYGEEDFLITNGGVKVNRVWKAKGIASKELSAIAIGVCVLFKRDPFEVIHVHQCNVLAFVMCIVAAIRRKPLFIKIANSGENFDLKTLRMRPLGAFMARTILESKAYVIALNRDIAREVLGMGVSPKRIVEIPNGVRLPRTEMVPTRKVNGKISVHIVGRLEETKSPFFVFEIAALLPHYQFNFYGSGTLEPRLRAYIRDLKVANVSLKGAEQDINVIYDTANLVLHPSKAEGMSNVLLESTVRGVPVVARAIEANILMYKDFEYCSVLVDSDSPTMWAAAIDLALARSDESGFEEATAKFRTRYSLSTVGAMVVAAYDRGVSQDS